MNPLLSERILIFDFGSQYVQLIARRVRELNVFAQIVRADLPLSRIKELAPKGIIFSGSPSSVYDPGAPTCDPALFDSGIPILGLCYGMQLACHLLGGKVQPGKSREFGRAHIHITKPEHPLFAGLPGETTVWMSHGDQVIDAGGLFIPLARTSTCPVAAVQHRSKPVYALQFHPEVSHTPLGNIILKNFLYSLCGCTGRWKMTSFVRDTIADLKQRIGNHRVICGLSGGVDSAVTAALLLKAVGPQVACIFVDNGLMRQDEVESVRKTFQDHFKADLHVVDARERFLSSLAGISDPQQKRKIIGHVFIDVFQAEANRIQGAKFLAQGTLYPDVIESGAAADGPAATIKTHHNVGGLPERLHFELIEPLRDLFKDEVRKVGLELGLSEEMVWRHPFPGPGLAVRCLGPVDEAKLNVLRQADVIFLDELHKAHLYNDVAQAFAVLLPVQSVGVMGDYRTYDNTIALRAVQTTDFMTADWAHLPHEFLSKVSTRIINEVRGVNRVVYDISSKPPATIEWE
jgi:GMP synthase (glutamine-hydrolysing)